MIIFENKNPTPAEMELFKYGGFYKILDNENCSKYVPVHLDRVSDFPKTIKAMPDNVEHNIEITFYHMAETVKCSGMFDRRLINLIQTRMNELGWEK